MPEGPGANKQILEAPPLALAHPEPSILPFETAGNV